MNRAPESLRRRLTRETLLLLLLFQVIGFVIGGLFVVRPLLVTATEDLATVMRLAARHWVDARPATDAIFDDHAYALRLQLDRPSDLRATYFPFAHFLGRVLAARSGEASPVPVQADGNGRYWAPVMLPEGTVWVGFDAERVGTRPPLVFLLLAIALIGLALGYSLLIAQRMTRPLRTLMDASERLGHGDTDVRVPESGPREVVALAQAFNNLAGRLRELLDNRATLLVGLSHDLRTPLARLRLSLEMIEGEGDAELVAGMVRDLDALKDLLDNVLTLESGLHLERGQQARIDDVVKDVVASARRSGRAIEFNEVVCALGVSELALKRVLENLIENAIRYGGFAPVRVTVRCSESGAVVEVADRGPGIPEDQREAVLRPFYRLDASRNSNTGGSGLGLAIVQQICRAQGWQLGLHDREGGGLLVLLKIRCE